MRLINLLACLLLASTVYSQNTLDISGTWFLKDSSGSYTTEVKVPGLIGNPKEFSPEENWLKKEITLPVGKWNYAVLSLFGARFNPKVYVNGKLISEKEGGMAPTYHLLKDENVLPGKKIILEICIQSLNKLPNSNASCIPSADRWRSNISSSLWDDVTLSFHKDLSIERLVPYTFFNEKKLHLKYELLQIGNTKLNRNAQLEIISPSNLTILKKECKITNLKDSLSIVLPETMQPWSPENPIVYKLRFTIFGKNRNEIYEMSYGFKHFETKNKHFYLNNDPITLRAGTVVWHRWIRDSFGTKYGWDTAWFVKNVILPLKERGANTLRFHLGTPPRRILELCDHYGLLVQYEWLFFHGLSASYESLTEQWYNWLNLSLLHPSVSLIHPYNETADEKLKTAWYALDSLIDLFPPLVLEDRDVLHIHKYWWSLFENVGIYYDSAGQFQKTIMVDEFGGNYLDENYNLGGYKTLVESYLRFLGPNHTAEQRKYHHTISNTRIAEYWKRIGAAGFSPFCILGSWEDGCHWYEGDLNNPKLKPVWDGLTAAYSPVTVSLDNWNRTYKPNSIETIYLMAFNEQKNEQTLNIRFSITSKNSIVTDTLLAIHCNEFENKRFAFKFKTPSIEDSYSMKAELLNKPSFIKHPIISEWDFRVFKAKADSIKSINISVPDNEPELLAYFKEAEITLTPLNENNNGVLVIGENNWTKIKNNDHDFIKSLEKAIDKNISILAIDIGNKYLGKDYSETNNNISLNYNPEKFDNSQNDSINFVFGTSFIFKKQAETESHIHPFDKSTKLYMHLNPDFCWLWNGMRGGIIVAAEDMEVHGLDQSSFLNKWATSGADTNIIKYKNYFVFELQGFFAFSEKENDGMVMKQLKEKVKFLVDDAPALAGVVNPNAPIQSTNLHFEYSKLIKSKAKELLPLIQCGKNLTRIPVLQMNFGENKGKVIVSQLLTKDRLYNKSISPFYKAAEDETAKQLIFNMIYLLGQ